MIKAPLPRSKSLPSDQSATPVLKEFPKRSNYRPRAQRVRQAIKAPLPRSKHHSRAQNAHQIIKALPHKNFVSLNSAIFCIIKLTECFRTGEAMRSMRHSKHRADNGFKTISSMSNRIPASSWTSPSKARSQHPTDGSFGRGQITWIALGSCILPIGTESHTDGSIAVW